MRWTGIGRSPLVSDICSSEYSKIRRRRRDVGLDPRDPVGAAAVGDPDAAEHHARHGGERHAVQHAVDRCVALGVLAEMGNPERRELVALGELHDRIETLAHVARGVTVLAGLEGRHDRIEQHGDRLIDLGEGEGQLVDVGRRIKRPRRAIRVARRLDDDHTLGIQAPAAISRGMRCRQRCPRLTRSARHRRAPGFPSSGHWPPTVRAANQESTMVLLPVPGAPANRWNFRRAR